MFCIYKKLSDMASFSSELTAGSKAAFRITPRANPTTQKPKEK
jgi:hypothetical protein